MKCLYATVQEKPFLVKIVFGKTEKVAIFATAISN